MDASARIEECPAPLSSVSEGDFGQTPKDLESSVPKLPEETKANKQILTLNSSSTVESSCQVFSPSEDIALTCSPSVISTEHKSPGVDSVCTSDGVSAIDSIRTPIPDFAAARQSLVRYKCDVCGRVCPSKHKLKRHLSTHSKERPFPCSICGRSFKWTEYLQKHMRQQHSVPSKESLINEAEKSLPPNSKLKFIKANSNVQAKEVSKITSDSNDSEAVLCQELEVRGTSTILRGEDKEVSKFMSGPDSSDEVDCGPTKHSISIGVDMDAEEEEEQEQEQDPEDSLPLLESNDLHLNVSSEVHPPPLHVYEACNSVEPTNFFHQPQVSCISTSDYSSLPISSIPSHNTATCFKPNFQYHQPMAHNNQYSVSPFEAACSLLNSNGLVGNAQSNSSSNLSASRSFDYCLGHSYEPTQITNTKMMDYCGPSQSSSTNFFNSSNNQNNFSGVFQMNNTSLSEDPIRDSSLDSAIQALSSSPQLSTTPVNPAICNSMESSYYSNGHNGYGVNSSCFQMDMGLQTSYGLPPQNQFGILTTTSLLQQNVSDSSTQLDYSDMSNIPVESDFSSDYVEEAPESVTDATGIDVGIQCDLGPETLQALADEEDDESDEKEEELNQTQNEVLEGNDSVELQAPVSDTIRSLLTEDRHVQKYPCRVPNCNKAYIYKKDVVRHMKIRHGITPQNLEAVLVETQEKPHICGVGHCRRSYYHLKDLKRHRRLCHQVSPCTSKVEKHPVIEEEVAEPDDIGGTKYLMRFPCDFPGCLRSYVHKKDLVRHKRLYHNDATSKPSIPIPVKYTENELKHIRQRVKQEIDTKVEKIRLDSTGSNTSASTGSDEESVICVSNEEDLTSETKCTILLSSSSSLQNVKPGIDLNSTITGDLASLLGAIEQHGPLFRNC